MTETRRIRYLRITLIVVGLLFILGLAPLTVVWPSGWAWHTGGRSEYLEMILGIYATLGVFLLAASRNPEAHLSLIRFTVWSSLVHGGIMGIQSMIDHRQMAHMWGDVAALFVVAATIAILMPRDRTIRSALPHAP
ncbi:MAG: DUF6632 domain-containing protein [Steroidobacteraceae bacterium]